MVETYNPWGSRIRRVEPFKVVGWESDNGWIAAGFK
jgi:hypothetical protein